jgi:TolA-binding protein
MLGRRGGISQWWSVGFRSRVAAARTSRFLDASEAGSLSFHELVSPPQRRSQSHFTLLDDHPGGARDLERRLSRLEALSAISSPSVRPVPAASRTEETDRSVPSLAVVKLKPKGENAPRLDTATPVVEPEAVEEPESVDRLMRDLAQAPAPVPEVDDAILHKQFEESVAALRTGNVEAGVARLQSFAEEHPKHPDSDNALYFAGLGLMGSGQHEQAAELFGHLVERFPAGDAVIDATLRLAECRERLKHTADAKALYTRVVTRYPGTAAATQAEQRLSVMPR